MTHVEFVVRPAKVETGYDLVVEWTANLGKQGSPVLQQLYEELSSAHGVDEADVGRYCAYVRVAHHVVTQEQARENVIDALVEEALGAEIAAHFGRPTTVIAKVLPEILTK